MSVPLIQSSPIVGYSTITQDDEEPSHQPPTVELDEASRSLTENSVEVSISQLDSEFETVGLSLSRSSLDPSTAIALYYCKKYILYFYNVLLVVIGWRALRSKYDNLPWYKKVFNAVHPLIIFLMLVFACASQIVTCFSRSRSHSPDDNVTIAGHEHEKYRVLLCDDHLVTSDIISYCMILSSFVIGYYVFRNAEPENVSSLAETVFLSYNKTSPRKSRKRPVFTLLFFVILGAIWFIASILISLLRLWSLHLYNTKTIIFWFTKNYTEHGDNSHLSLRVDKGYNVMHYFLTISAFVGFSFFDLLYIAVVLNYCFQCQLLTYYIRNIIDKVHSKAYGKLSEACKVTYRGNGFHGIYQPRAEGPEIDKCHRNLTDDVYRLYEFLKQLNRWLSWITTLILFSFIGNLIASYRDLNSTKGLPNLPLGFFNIAQWLTAALFPIIMATRFTAAAKSLVRLGLSIAQRPYSYSQVSDIELQFFLTYMNSTNFAAKLAFVPMYPPLVCGSIFIMILMISLGIVIPRVDTVRWF